MESSIAFVNPFAASPPYSCHVRNEGTVALFATRRNELWMSLFLFLAVDSMFIYMVMVFIQTMLVKTGLWYFGFVTVQVVLVLVFLILFTMLIKRIAVKREYELSDSGVHIFLYVFGRKWGGVKHFENSDVEVKLREYVQYIFTGWFPLKKRYRVVELYGDEILLAVLAAEPENQAGNLPLKEVQSTGILISESDKYRVLWPTCVI